MTQAVNEIVIVGGGLAGSEAAWQVAERGVRVRLYEMRPHVATGAHASDRLAELVCSNSLGSDLADRAGGLLKAELRRLGSLLLDVAAQTAVPAGGALAVDRQAFAERATERLCRHPNVTVVRREVTEIPGGLTILASGPLTSPALSDALGRFTGENNLSFFDAIAPIVAGDSIDHDVAFRASRYGDGREKTGDYLNCPFTREAYDLFVEALVHAERIPLRDFEEQLRTGVKAGVHHFFEGCLPAEIIAERGHEALAFGPMRPMGLKDPRTGRRPYAVLQLRQDDLLASAYNLVGFQTNLIYPEQQRVFRLAPGLAKAEFVRYGQMHRNTFIASPRLLWPTLQSRQRPDLFFAGQITGVEGYAGNVATGLLAGINAVRHLRGQALLTLPPTTMLGALLRYVTEADLADFQPMKANFGLLPPSFETTPGKRARGAKQAERALAHLDEYLSQIGTP